jgi:hypothetical protein
MRRGNFLLLVLGFVFTMACSSGTTEQGDIQNGDLQELPSAQDAVEDASIDGGGDNAVVPDLPQPDDLPLTTDQKLVDDIGEESLDSVNSEDPGTDISLSPEDSTDTTLLADTPLEPIPDVGQDTVAPIVDVPSQITDPGLVAPDIWLDDLMNDDFTTDANTTSCDPSLCVSSDPFFSAACVDGICQLSASEGATTGSCTAPLPVPLSYDNPVIEVTVPANQLHSIIGLDACLASPGAGQYVLQFEGDEGAIVALTNTNSVGGTEQFVLSVRDTCGSFGAGGFVVCSPLNLGLAGQLEGGSYFAVVNQWLGFGASIPFLQWSFTMRLELLDELPTNPDPSE